MKLIGNNGEVLAEWVATGAKRNIYCHGGFGLMLTKKALARCVRADDVETIDMFKSPDPVPASEQVEAAAVPEQVEKHADVSKEPAPVKAEVPAPEPVKAQEESAQADNATDGLFGG